MRARWVPGQRSHSMVATLTLRVETDRGVTERIYVRTPVFIGRDVGPGHCKIDDRSASKLHASVDVRDRQILVRDAASTNGTFSKGNRLDADRWTSLGPAEGPVEFTVGAATITAWATEQEESATAMTSASLGGLVAGVLSQEERALGAASFPSTPSAGVGVAWSPDAFERQRVLERLAPACQHGLASLATLEVLIHQELAAASAPERPAICHELLRAHPQLATCDGIAKLLASHGVGTSRVTAGTGPLEAAALTALQELVSWYIGAPRTLTRPDEIAAFQQRLRTTLDDLLLGYPPLLAGLNQFERQMAIRLPNASAGAQVSAADLARALLDWQITDEPTRTELRANLTELTMHQVALLRGVMRGVKALLAELSPEVIEQTGEREATPQGAVRRLFARPDPWATYKRRHSDLADEENERFRLLFGADFVNEYRQFIHEARAETPEGEGKRK